MINTEAQIGWQDYLAIILRRRWFFAIPCSILVSGSLVAGLFMQKIYRAETILMVQEQNVANPLIQGLAVSTPVGERLRVLREELLSWTSLSRLVNELKLDRNAKNPAAFESLIRRLQQDINVRMRGGNLIAIGYEDPEPKHAQTVVNAITKIYMDRNVESQNADTETAITVIESEMKVYKKQLEDAERALRDFKELYIMQMPVATQLNEQIVGLEVNLAQLLVENTEQHPTVKQVRGHIKELKQKRNDEIKRVIATAIAKGHDAEVYHDLAAALEHPVDAGKDADPTMRAAKEAYQAWIKRLDSNPETSAGGNGPQIQVAVVAPSKNGAGPMEMVGASGSTSLSLAPREEQELARLTRDYQVYSGTYQSMQERLERAKMTQRLGKVDEGTKFKVLEPARLPLRPVRPNYGKIFVFGLLLGICAGAGVAFVAEYLDQSFQSAEEVQAALEVPVIGSISTIVTEADVAARRKRQKGWISVKGQFLRVKRYAMTYVIGPVWGVCDRVLVKWGL